MLWEGTAPMIAGADGVMLSFVSKSAVLHHHVDCASMQIRLRTSCMLARLLAFTCTSAAAGLTSTRQLTSLTGAWLGAKYAPGSSLRSTCLCTSHKSLEIHLGRCNSCNNFFGAVESACSHHQSSARVQVLTGGACLPRNSMRCVDESI